MIKINAHCSLTELAAKIDAKLSTSAKQMYGNLIIHNVSTIKEALPGDVTFLINNKYCNLLRECKASAVILPEQYISYSNIPCLVSDNPKLSLAKLMQLCIPANQTNYNIHPSAIIGANCNIATDACIGPNCVIADRVTIQKGVRIGAGVTIGNDCNIGENSELKTQVVLYDKVKIGACSIVHSGTVIGSDGFGYANDADGNWVKMPHLGGVIIGDSVEIGSNVSIDRGFLENTIIANGVKIDNLVQIGHNVSIGEKTAIAGCVAVAGSVNIGARCLIGGGSSIAGHINLTDGVIITGTSAVNRSLLKPGIYSSGFPAKENHLWKKNVARFGFLDDMAKRIRVLEQSLQVESKK